MFNWSIKIQIFTVVFILAAISVIVCSVGLYAVQGLDDAVDEVDTTARRLADIDEVAAHISEVIIGVREVLLTTDETKKADDKRAIDEKVAVIDKQMKAIGSVTRLTAEWGALESEWEKHKTIVGNIVDLAMRNNIEPAVEALGSQCNPTRAREGAILKDILAKQKDFFQAASDSAAIYHSRALIILLSVTGIGLALGIGLAWLTVARLSRKLTEIIDDLSERSSELGRIASEVSLSSSSLAEASTEQAASLEETSATLEEMSSMTKSNSENAARTSQSTSQTVKLIEEGGRSVRTVTQAMTEISSSSEQISQIIKTIEGIAFQTNLLALNAAVEAARAGEAGQGFAVVADEVRNLALRSAQAAKDTSDLIQNTVGLVRDGSQNVEELAAGFSEIEKGAQEVGRLIVEISSATNEQALGVGQVNTAVAQMDKVTQSNAAMAEESASSSVALSDQTHHLENLVQGLYALIHGGRAEAGSIPPRMGQCAAARRFSQSCSSGNRLI